MGTAAVAYIALLASRLPWFLGGAAPAAAGAGYFVSLFTRSAATFACLPQELQHLHAHHKCIADWRVRMSSQTRKTTTIRRTADSHYIIRIRTPLKSLEHYSTIVLNGFRGPSQHYRIEGFKGTINGASRLHYTIRSEPFEQQRKTFSSLFRSAVWSHQ